MLGFGCLANGDGDGQMCNGRKEPWAWAEAVSVGTVKCDGLTGRHEAGEERGGQLVRASCGE